MEPNWFYQNFKLWFSLGFSIYLWKIQDPLKSAIHVNEKYNIFRETKLVLSNFQNLQSIGWNEMKIPEKSLNVEAPVIQFFDV